MLSLDSLVTDLMFAANAALDQKTLIEGLGGEDALGQKKLLDVDMLDPRAEMELSPSMPFRRRGERRLLLIDDTVEPKRADPWIGLAHTAEALGSTPEADSNWRRAQAIDPRHPRLAEARPGVLSQK